VRLGHKQWSDVETSVLTRFGLANVIGASLSFFTGTLVDGTGNEAGHSQRDLIVFLAYMAVVFPIGGFIAHRDAHGVTAWRFGAALGPEKRRSLLRLPLRIACWALVFWLGAAVLFGGLQFVVDGDSLVYSLRVAGTIVLGGLTTAGITFLLLERAMRPVFQELFALDAPDGTKALGIRTRLLVSWALGAAIPLMIIALAFVGRSSSNNPNLRAAVWALTAVGIIVGAIVIVTAAQSITEPLDSIRSALAKVQRDDLDVDVPVDDGGEVGQLQAGFNRMVAGLRDRRALEDLFGRHVGSEVATLAREEGVHLGGERREASIVFVDLVGSSHLAQSRSASDVVALLNTFFGTVVERIEQEGGWVNKFEGDAALCVFGAPAAQPDHATRALRAARTLRRDLLALSLTHPELVAGIGVSAGDVAAGNVGAAHRYEYTVIGDPVNEAARLTEAAKARPGGVLASEEAVARASEAERKRWVVADELALRGRSEPTLAYEPRVQSTVTSTVT
jgi:adenylate cyclase